MRQATNQELNWDGLSHFYLLLKSKDGDVGIKNEKKN